MGEENPIDETGQQQNRFPLFRLLIFSCPIFVLGGRWIMRNLFQRAGNEVRNVAGRIRSAFFLAEARVPQAPDFPEGGDCHASEIRAGRV